jgi:hypothetical protein
MDPDRYGKKATSLLKEEEKKLPERGKITTRSEFFDAYIELEKTIRDFLKKHRFYEPIISFRQMVDALLKAEIIKYSLRSELLQINDVRNLVFHSQKEEIDSHFIDRVRKVNDELKDIFRNYNRAST